MDRDLNNSLSKNSLGMDMETMITNAEIILQKERSRLGLLNYLAIQNLCRTIDLSVEQLQETYKIIEDLKGQIKDLSDKLIKSERTKKMQFEALKALKQETDAITWRDALSTAAMELAKEGIL